MDMEERENPKPFPAVTFDEFSPTSYDEWRKEAETALKGAPFERRLLTRTYEDITLEPIYRMEDIENLTHPLTLPGTPDYLRGTDRRGYMDRPWSIAQAIDEYLPEEANKAVKKELSGGSNSIHLVLNQSTRDCVESSDRYDTRGLSLATLKDVDDLLTDLDLTTYPIHLFAGASSAPMLGLMSARAVAQGKRDSLRSRRGCIGADPIGTLAGSGHLSCPMDELMDEMALSIQWGRESAPELKTVLIRGDVYHDGGANCVQELACSMATGIAYIRAMTIRGIDVDDIASQIRFSFPVGANFFMEIAKLRAARMFWSRIVRSFGGKDESAKIDLFASTSRFTQTVYDPYVNVLRGTTQAFSAVIGGADSLWVRRFDDPIRTGTEQSRRISRNIQVLLQNEFNLRQPIDPVGGSWYVEKLTDQVYRKSWEYMQEIESSGGILEALKTGKIQDDVAGVLKSRQEKLNRRSDRAVGTNAYANVTERPLDESPRSDRDEKSVRKKAISEYRELTDELHREKTLKSILDSIGGEPGAFMKALIETFMAGATLSEVRHILDDGFQGDIRVRPIAPHRWTERFEELRRRTEDFAVREGGFKIFLAGMGPLKRHKARSDFSASFMEVANFEVIRNDGFDTIQEAVSAASESGAAVTVICSSDESYPDLVPPLAKALKENMPEMKVLLAGAPAPEFKEIYEKSGVDDFIHVRANCFEILESLQRTGGMFQ
ncbi:acyl-CoA mutase large subunit family protein [Dethiosulfovibrio sp. F2B]|nr:acyl-CoA mutase large subunit family protein [Dethiosulfovibrio faecalis]